MRRTFGVLKLLLVLATVTIVDPAGNRVHTDEELPSHGGETPVQTPEDRDRNLEILQRMFGGHNSQHLDDRPFDQEQRRGP